MWHKTVRLFCDLIILLGDIYDQIHIKTSIGTVVFLLTCHVGFIFFDSCIFSVKKGTAASTVLEAIVYVRLNIQFYSI